MLKIMIEQKKENLSLLPTKYSHTLNITNGGVRNGNYTNNAAFVDVVTIPGASRLEINITYATESSSLDWVCMWVGEHPNYTAANNYGSSLTGRLGGVTQQTNHYSVEGNTVTFGFRSDASVSNYYGYYAVITGIR